MPQQVGGGCSVGRFSLGPRGFPTRILGGGFFGSLSIRREFLSSWLLSLLVLQSPLVAAAENADRKWHRRDLAEWCLKVNIGYEPLVLEDKSGLGPGGESPPGSMKLFESICARADELLGWRRGMAKYEYLARVSFDLQGGLRMALTAHQALQARPASLSGRMRFSNSCRRARRKTLRI